MTTRLVIRRLAGADISTTRRWYERERRGAGEEFIQELDHLFARIRALPLQFPEVHRRARRALLRRYPYAVFFVPRDTTIFVVAVLHQRREPNAWEKRVHAEEAG
jgi:plasmid stabilization system protein ParE